MGMAETIERPGAARERNGEQRDNRNRFERGLAFLPLTLRSRMLQAPTPALTRLTISTAVAALLIS